MILHLGDDVSVHSADIVAIIDLTQSQSPVTGAMLAEIRRQNRILARAGHHRQKCGDLRGREARGRHDGKRARVSVAHIHGDACAARA